MSHEITPARREDARTKGTMLRDGVRVHRSRALVKNHAIIDLMIGDPSLPLKEIAERMGMTPTNLSMIVNSDMFRAMLSERRALWREDHDLPLMAKNTALAHATLDVMLESVKKKRDKIPFTDLLQANKQVMAQLGYGIEDSNQGKVTVNVQQNVATPVSREALENARANIRHIEQQKSAPRTVTPLLEALLPEASGK